MVFLAGIPKVAEPILKLRMAVDSRRTESSRDNPVVVHCRYVTKGCGLSLWACCCGKEQEEVGAAGGPARCSCVRACGEGMT